MVLLAELLALRIGDHWQVAVVRYAVAQQLLQINLPRGRVKQVAAAHHMGDTLSGVICYHRKLVGDKAVFALDYKVRDICPELAVLDTLQLIVELDMWPCGTVTRVATAVSAG